MSALLDGVGDRIAHANAPTTRPTQVTIIAWVKPTGNIGDSRATIHAYYDNGSDSYLGLFGTIAGTTGAFAFRAPWNTGSGVWRTADDTATPNAWQGVAVTYDAGADTNDPVLYLKPDGGAISTPSLTEVSAPSGAFVTAMDQLWSGGVQTSYQFAGRIAYLRVFEGQILTSTQIDAELSSAAAVLAGCDLDCPFVADFNDDTASARDGSVGGDVVIDGDNPSLGGAPLTQSVSGASTNSGEVSFVVSINGLAGASTNSGSLSTALFPAGGGGGPFTQSVGGTSTNSGSVATSLIPAAPDLFQQTLTGASTNSGAVFTTLNPTVGGSGFPMRFLQPRTE